jgi:restriction endonuclease S subunit
MKKRWPTKPLGEVCEVFADGDWVESKDQSSEGIRLIQTGNVGEGVFKDRADKARYISEATFKRLRCTEIVEGDCLVSRLPDPVGRSCILPDTGERMITAVDCTILRFNPNQLLPTFFNFYSQSDDYLTTVAKECTGTTRNRISRSNLGLTPFTQRGPGWVETTLGEVCEQITDGKHGDCEAQADSGYYFLSAKDVKDGTLNYEGARQITKVDFQETHRRTRLESGDILITNSGTIGRMAIAPKDDRTARTTFQKSVAILKPVNAAIDSRFAFYCLSSGLARFVNLSAGAAQKNLLLRDLRSYRFAMPKSLDEQRVVGRSLDALSEETQRLARLYERKHAALEALKKSLLHQAFTGEL